VNPFPIVLSSPSGGGKTTITEMLLERRHDVGYSVSCTTRRPRDGEVDGRDYYFIARDDFLARQSKGAFAESAEVHGNLYGTLRAEVERVFASRRHVIMDIDVQGATQFATAYPESVLIFLLPPSAETLLARLAGRGTEDRSEFVQRVRGAREELKAVSFYHYAVVNDDLENTYHLVSSIVDTESVRHARIPHLDSQVRQLISELDREILSLAPSA
jgi:guanylate kinase